MSPEQIELEERYASLRSALNAGFARGMKDEELDVLDAALEDVERQIAALRA